eukprot:m.61755 g.61755  ORF g.61755 m.61755 type:complete len:365 (-) comp7365_c0_seq1:201-1295(-)
MAWLIKDFDVTNRLMFPQPPSSYTATSLGRDLVWLGERQDVPVAVLKSGQRQVRGVLLHMHGNGEDLGRAYPFLCELREVLDVHVVAVEYPGYGLCPGTPNESGCNRNARLAYDYVTKELGCPPDRVVLLGQSIGSGVATQLAASLAQHGTQIGALVLLSPFLSIKALAKSLVGPVLANMALNRFNNQRNIAHVTAPTLFIHGRQDELIPCEHSTVLHELSPAAIKYLRLLEGAGHNNLDAAQVLSFIAAFFDLARIPLGDVELNQHALRALQGPQSPLITSVSAMLFASSASSTSSTSCMERDDNGHEPSEVAPSCSSAVCGQSLSAARRVGRIAATTLSTLIGATLALVEFDGSERVDSTTM